jgi:hypothetical protein
MAARSGCLIIVQKDGSLLGRFRNGEQIVVAWTEYLFNWEHFVICINRCFAFIFV